STASQSSFSRSAPGNFCAPVTLSERASEQKGASEMATATGHTQAIQASRVIGTDVFNTDGKHIGSIEDVMLDKLSTNVMFAVIGFGGFLGIGEKYHAIPWSSLDYVPSRGGYVVPFTREQLEAAPVYDIADLTSGDGKRVRDSSYDYYRV